MGRRRGLPIIHRRNVENTILKSEDREVCAA
jgi:hypothetical protein